MQPHPMDTKAAGELQNQVIAAQMAMNGLMLPQKYRGQLGILSVNSTWRQCMGLVHAYFIYLLNGAGSEQRNFASQRRRPASFRPSQQEIEEQCAAVAKKCNHRRPQDDAKFGNVKFDLESSRIAQQQEFSRQQRLKKEATIRQLEAYLDTPADAEGADAETERVNRTKAEIRLIGLRMADYQAQVREQVRVALQEKLDETNGIDYTVYRGHRKNHRRHFSSKQKKQQRQHREAQKSQKIAKTSRLHDESLVSFSKSFKKDHSEHLIRQRKVLRSMSAFHTQREREEKKKASEAEKDRIRALKENDEEAYMKLLEETKNDRLLTLVRETDSALYSLGAKIRAHKTGGDASAAASLDAAVKRGKDQDTDAEPQDIDNSRVHPDLLKTKQAYYEVSHTVKEVVKEQPLSLSGGTLKEYQIKGLEWLVSLYNNGLNGILADEMGLGKTIQAIAVLCHVMEKRDNTGPFLIVVPNSTLPNWANEFEQWAPHMERVIYKVSHAYSLFTGVPMQTEMVSSYWAGKT